MAEASTSSDNLLPVTIRLPPGRTLQLKANIHKQA